MLEVAVIEDAAVAEATLVPLRARLLAELAEPGTASSLAARVGQPRQKVNYHLHELERYGLIELVEERRKGSMIERVLQATAKSYVISPILLAAVAPDPRHSPDRLSARWLLALASRLVSDMGSLIAGAARAGKPVATFALDGEVRFASVAARAAFAEELTAAVTGLVGKYHVEEALDGRKYRVVVAVHPALDSRPADSAEAAADSADKADKNEES
ncbi:ArsR/SmtB family transcription factor [Hamadaea tsunoensis]|uniref:ArsR/SmtB family transcription factor n=1 Tax=Hamadaea tsunoensis TaxID=53368 RepID=UPI000688FAFE|nr:helix-turn-helix domain-containing protein [Hamadaea tsunoensis]